MWSSDLPESVRSNERFDVWLTRKKINRNKKNNNKNKTKKNYDFGRAVYFPAEALQESFRYVHSVRRAMHKLAGCNPPRTIIIKSFLRRSRSARLVKRALVSFACLSLVPALCRASSMIFFFFLSMLLFLRRWNEEASLAGLFVSPQWTEDGIARTSLAPCTFDPGSRLRHARHSPCLGGAPEEPNSRTEYIYYI